MRIKVSLVVFASIFLLLAGVAQAQVGIGRYERLQIAAHDLEEQARLLHFRAERQNSRSRSDTYVVNRLHRLHDAAASFHDQVERNFDDPGTVRRAYQRLAYAVSDADYALRRSYRYGHLNYEFRQVTRGVNIVQRLLPGYRYDRYDNDHDNDHDYDHDDDYDDYDR